MRSGCDFDLEGEREEKGTLVFNNGEGEGEEEGVDLEGLGCGCCAGGKGEGRRLATGMVTRRASRVSRGRDMELFKGGAREKMSREAEAEGEGDGDGRWRWAGSMSGSGPGLGKLGGDGGGLPKMGACACAGGDGELMSGLRGRLFLMESRVANRGTGDAEEMAWLSSCAPPVPVPAAALRCSCSCSCSCCAMMLDKTAMGSPKGGILCWWSTVVMESESCGWPWWNKEGCRES
mmetsp:Transcript_13232/g.21720  ORF Transcript_13232/g.21720 Transcript_13232/m.21720 type:complete len:234 (+) Transcript_13232:771-1472(+)